MSNIESQTTNIEKAIELIEPTGKPHILEFGVAGGRSLKTIKNNAGNSYEYYGFDSFIGLPEDWVVTKNTTQELVAKKENFNYRGA